MEEERGGSPETSYKQIKVLEDKIKKNPDRIALHIGDEFSPYMIPEKLRGIRLPLEDGSSITIVSPAESDNDETSREIRGVDIGAFYFIVEPNRFVICRISFHVQLNLGGKVIGQPQAMSAPFIDLNSLEQKAVIDWIETSIVNKRLGESPVKLNFSLQGKEPKS